MAEQINLNLDRFVRQNLFIHHKTVQLFDGGPVRQLVRLRRVDCLQSCNCFRFRMIASQVQSPTHHGNLQVGGPPPDSPSTDRLCNKQCDQIGWFLCTLGNFVKPLAKINLATFIDIWRFFSGHTSHKKHFGIKIWPNFVNRCLSSFSF